MLPFYEVSEEYTVRVTLSADPCCLQDSCVTQLNQHFLFVKLVCLPVVVGLDAPDKMGLANDHFG